MGKMQVLSKGSLKLKTLTDAMMKSLGFHKVLCDVMFHRDIQSALKANRKIPHLVVPGDVTFSTKVSRVGLPLVIKGTDQIGRVKVYFDRDAGQVHQYTEPTIQYEF